MGAGDCAGTSPLDVEDFEASGMEYLGAGWLS